MVANKGFPFPGLIRWVLVLIFITCQINFSHSQNAVPVLERRITIKLVRERTDAALNSIGKQAGFSFSYNSSLIDPAAPVSINVVNKSVREVLNTLFNGEIEYKAKSNHIILQKSKSTPVVAQKNEPFVLSGYVRDSLGNGIPFTSIYDKKSLESTVSNDYGFYRIQFYQKQTPLSLTFSRQNYIDTIVSINQPRSEFINIELKSSIKNIPAPLNRDSLFSSVEETARHLFSNHSMVNTSNISDTIYREAQVSFIPFVGSNGSLSGNVINKYSLNVFGGYSLGTTTAELGGFFNIDRSDVRYFQGAGFVNLVGGNLEGVQLAGFVNGVRGNVNGMQAAGFVNLDWNNLEGPQFAGFVNTVRGKLKGGQFVGFVNTVVDSAQGVQVAGFCNVAGRNMIGTQISGFVNLVAEDLKGTQIGFYNQAKHVKGTQIGFMNFTDSISGIPVGFLSYVNSGYHKLELSADEVFPLNIAFRTGVNAFHNILTAGISPANWDTILWTFGYGVGTTKKLSKGLSLDLDLTSNQVVPGDNFDKINLINKAYLGAEVKLSNKFGLAFGATVNGQLTDSNYSKYPDIFSMTSPNVFYRTHYEKSHLDLKMWLGGKIALRFF